MAIDPNIGHRNGSLHYLEDTPRLPSTSWCGSMLTIFPLVSYSHPVSRSYYLTPSDRSDQKLP
jgi:hypothetical protein